MASLVYQIVMGTGLALAIDKNNPNKGNQLILANRHPDDPDQLWSWVFYPATQASILYNPGRNLIAAPATLERGAGVVLFDANAEPTGASTWQILSPSNSAIRPPANTDLNLNALGSSWPIGTKVGIWSWGGGGANEVWSCQLLRR